MLSNVIYCAYNIFRFSGVSLSDAEKKNYRTFIGANLVFLFNALVLEVMYMQFLTA